ncbi:unnamed protein product [Zymoseptoria tritici ST99CH_3D7]|uniref:Uncharacterized protein n=1 Tax=Zymoseptoria tritici (strain ST99CH_3D7) TaxID=1276538 RepID=A0A1X7RBZ5_ZYMT9|nr:unnamed protein product [Zymoseptoria tritici ST99CH_3D7]
MAETGHIQHAFSIASRTCRPGIAMLLLSAVLSLPILTNGRDVCCHHFTPPCSSSSDFFPNLDLKINMLVKYHRRHSRASHWKDGICEALVSRGRMQAGWL